MQLNKTKPDKTKPIKPNNPQISIQNMYILLTCISNVTFNPQLVLFDRHHNESNMNLNIKC